jgi:hypothetical protein
MLSAGRLHAELVVGYTFWWNGIVIALRHWHWQWVRVYYKRFVGIKTIDFLMQFNF